MKYRFKALYLLSLVMAFLCSPALADKTLEIVDPWIREAPPTSKVLAGYMTIVNPGEHKVTIESVSSRGFGSAELHRTVIENGVARMLHMERLEVPANSTVRLEPGGLHLMLFNPDPALVEGDSARLTLQLDNDSCLTITAPVKRMTGADHLHHH